MLVWSLGEGGAAEPLVAVLKGDGGGDRLLAGEKEEVAV